MIHYHGLPITPNSAALKVVSGGHAFVSFAHSDQLTIAMEVAQSFAIDNGAFSAWKSGNPITDWSDYFNWVEDICRHPGFDFCVIPDEIDGDEHANLKLIARFTQRFKHNSYEIGAPVWHLHESIDRLQYLARAWQRVCIGSSGQFSEIGTPKWWRRMNEAMNAICVDGFPICKVHGLRMLDPEIFRHFPFASADSTNIGRNIGIDQAWRGTYMPPNKEIRALVMKERIESVNGAAQWVNQPEQAELVA